MINWNATFDETSFTSHDIDLNSTDLDPNKQDSVRDLLTTAVKSAGEEWGKYLIGPPLGLDANIDLRIVIDNSTEGVFLEHPRSDILDSNVVSISPNLDNILDNPLQFYQYGAAFEVNTGLDLTLGDDIVIHVNPDVLKNDLWYDPTTLPPDGKADAVSAFAHEIGHALAFNGFMNNLLVRSGGRHTPFDDHVMRDGDALFFDGPNTDFVWHGHPVPLNWQANVKGSDPYHLEGDLAAPALRNDLMSSGTSEEYHFGGKRYEISPLDLAILADSGINVDAPLTRASSGVIATSKNQSLTLDGNFGVAAQDPNGNKIASYALWDWNDDPNSGHLWIPNGGDQPGGRVVVVSESDFHNSRFISGSASGKDELEFAAIDDDGTMGPWAHSIAETALPADLSLIA